MAETGNLMYVTHKTNAPARSHSSLIGQHQSWPVIGYFQKDPRVGRNIARTRGRF